jgi:hypothetical protein
MGNPKIGSGDRELIRKRCPVLNGSRGSCDGCKYYPDNQRTKMYDCIGFVNQLLNWAEIQHYGAGCSTMWNHDANWEKKGDLKQMPETPCLVFQDYKGNKKKMQHIGFYDGKGSVIHCSVEVKKQKLSDYPWTDYAIPKGMGGVTPPGPEPGPEKKPTIRRGDKGPYVKECQEDLLKLGYDVGKTGADGIFGKNTEAAVKNFQRDHQDKDGKQLKADGIVGQRTWGALDDAIGENGTQDVPVIGAGERKNMLGRRRTETGPGVHMVSQLQRTKKDNERRW